MGRFYNLLRAVNRNWAKLIWNSQGLLQAGHKKLNVMKSYSAMARKQNITAT